MELIEIQYRLKGLKRIYMFAKTKEVLKKIEECELEIHKLRQVEL